MKIRTNKKISKIMMVKVRPAFFQDSKMLKCVLDIKEMINHF